MPWRFHPRRRNVPPPPSYPVVTFQNKLTIPFKVYDAFRNDPSAPMTPDTFFGNLTPLATLQAEATQAIQPIHGPISTYLVLDVAGNPLAREFTMGGGPKAFVVDDRDTARMQATNRFVDLDPNDPLKTAFKPLLTGKRPGAAVNSFFKQHPPYDVCTFVSYLMVIAARARMTGRPVESASYSLSTLCEYLGGTWPPGFPDIAVTNFECSNDNDTFVAGGEVSLQNIPYMPDWLPFLQSVLPSKPFYASFSFHYGLDAGVFGTTISFILESLALPAGASLKSPSITIEINPLFKFVVFTATARVPFSIFNSPQFNADLSLVIDNIEAEVGIVLARDTGPLLTPPVMKGVHFDEFGVGVGIFLEPPEYALGVEGKFHIGRAGQVQLDDDTFVIVCTMKGEVPEPLYVSFYVPKLDLGEVIAIFTDSTMDVGVPISVSGLSFRYSESPLKPVALPDGTLSKMGYGFTGTFDVLGLSFYGDAEIGADGIHGEQTMSPFKLGPLELSGNGAGVTVKVDARGNPIRNNQIPKTRAGRDAIKNATTKQIVEPGGPSLKISTSSPYLTLGVKVSLFDVIGEELDATIDKAGAAFELDYGAVLETKMRCVLSDHRNFAGEFRYGLDESIPLPTIAGFSLGSISVQAQFDAKVSIKLGTNVEMSLGGSFDFDGLTLSVGPFDADVNITKVSDLLSSIEHYLLDHVKDIFKNYLDPAKWTDRVRQGIITGVTDVADGLRVAFGKTAQETAALMSTAGYAVGEAANAIKNAFRTGADDLARALQSGYGIAAKDAAIALKGAGYEIGEIAGALKNVFGAAPSDVHHILQGIGYGTGEIKRAFEGLGGDFASWAHSTWDHARSAVSKIVKKILHWPP